MTDLFPKLFATSKTITHFSTTLGGFQDDRGNFKMFDGNESPTTQTPFISVEISPGGRDQRTGWQVQTAMFHFTGLDTDTAALWTMANALVDYYESHNAFSDGTVYQTVGQAEFAPPSTNPVTEHKIITAALHFGMAE